ncbi:hypothetical protein IAU60_006019 [Kwoniella sp. DSM 27419]
MAAEQTKTHPSLQTQTAPPPEIESTLARLSAYRNVRGVMILSRQAPVTVTSAASDGLDESKEALSGDSAGASLGGIVQSTGSAFEGEGGRKYASAVEGIVASVSRAVGDVDPGDELKLMRIRTKRHELIITPDEKYLLVVLQDPGQ